MPLAILEPMEPPPAAAGRIEPRRPLLLRREPRRSAAVAGSSPAGAPAEALSGSEGVATAALDAPSLVLGR